jgi:hypothetical protein
MEVQQKNIAVARGEAIAANASIKTHRWAFRAN